MQNVLYVPDNIHLLIRIKAKKEALDTLLIEIYKTIAPTHKEEGCLEYRVFHEGRDIFIFGTWKSKMALDMHLILQFHLHLVETVLPELSKKVRIHVSKELEPPITALSLG